MDIAKHDNYTSSRGYSVLRSAVPILKAKGPVQNSCSCIDVYHHHCHRRALWLKVSIG